MRNSTLGAKMVLADLADIGDIIDNVTNDFTKALSAWNTGGGPTVPATPQPQVRPDLSQKGATPSTGMTTSGWLLIAAVGALVAAFVLSMRR